MVLWHVNYCCISRCIYNTYTNTYSGKFCCFTYEWFINFLTLVFRYKERDTILTMLIILSDPISTRGASCDVYDLNSSSLEPLRKKNRKILSTLNLLLFLFFQIYLNNSKSSVFFLFFFGFFLLSVIKETNKRDKYKSIFWRCFLNVYCFYSSTVNAAVDVVCSIFLLFWGIHIIKFVFCFCFLLDFFCCSRFLFKVLCEVFFSYLFFGVWGYFLFLFFLFSFIFVSEA